MIKVELTEEEFALIFEGLDAIKSKESASDIMVTMFATAISKDADQEKRIMQELAQVKRKQSGALQVKQENVQILKGKLLQSKRIAAEENALRQTEEALKK